MPNSLTFDMDSFQGARSKRRTMDPMISKLREAGVELVMGLKVPQFCKKLEVTKQTYCQCEKSTAVCGWTG